MLYIMVDPWLGFRRMSRGCLRDPPAKIHTNILFGPGCFLTEEFVKKHNITHVINCAQPKDCPEWFPKQFPNNYLCLDAQDSLTVNITEWFYEFEKTMNKFLMESKTIYVHCQAGMNRSGFLCVLYGCKKFGYSFDVMTNTILRQRPCALTNLVFKTQVIDYIKKLR